MAKLDKFKEEMQKTDASVANKFRNCDNAIANAEMGKRILAEHLEKPDSDLAKMKCMIKFLDSAGDEFDGSFDPEFFYA